MRGRWSPASDLDRGRTGSVIAGRPPAWTVGAVGLAIGAAIAVRLLAVSGMDPTAFLGEGNGKPVQLRYAERLLGDVEVRARAGHDGKFFFAQANDPWFLDPEQNAAVLDRPLYRGQRMLYPVLAGGFGLFPPNVVVWSLIVVNVIAFGVGTFLTAEVAMRLGSSSWLGLAFALNIGLIFELAIDGSGVVAFAFCLVGLLALMRERLWLAALAFMAAALARDVMLAFAGGLFALEWFDGRRALWKIVLLPLSGLLVWSVYLRIRLAGVSGAGGAPRVFDVPFVGVVGGIRSWLREPDDLPIDVLIFVIIVAFGIGAWRSRVPLAWGALPFVPLAALLADDVWAEPFDLSRAVAPIFTAAAFLVIANRHGRLAANQRHR